MSSNATAEAEYIATVTPYLLSVLNTTIVQALSHGIYTALYIYVVYSMFGHDNIRDHKTVFTVITFLYLVTTAHLGLNWLYVQNGFVYNGATIEDVVNYLVMAPPHFMFASIICFEVATFTADCFIIWRCWVVWGKRWLAILPPIIFTIVGTVFAGFSYYQQVQAVTNSSLSATSIWSASVIDWSTPYFSMSLATTLYCTILIVWRIASIADMHNRTYQNIVEIIAESGALYSISMILLLAFFVQNIPASNYMVSIVDSVTGISPTLLVARVLSGIERPQATWDRPVMTRLSFGRSGMTAAALSDTRVDNSSDILEMHTNTKRSDASYLSEKV